MDSFALPLLFDGTSKAFMPHEDVVTLALRPALSVWIPQRALLIGSCSEEGSAEIDCSAAHQRGALMSSRGSFAIVLAAGLASSVSALPVSSSTALTPDDHGCVTSEHACSGHDTPAQTVSSIEAQQRAYKLIELQTFFSLPESHRETITNRLEAQGETAPVMPTLSEDAPVELVARSQPLSAEEFEAAWQSVKEYTSREAFERFAPVHQRMLAGFTKVVREHQVPVAPCFAPGTDPAVIEAFEAVVFGNPAIAFQQTARWQGTALNPGGAAQGDPTILTYSFPNDGVTVPDGVGEGSGPNSLNAFLDGIYGNRATWRAIYDEIFARWGELSGVTYILEPNDDNVTLFNSAGVSGVRGDLRMAGKAIDGNSGILAYNFFPQNGDMVIDTADNFYTNLGGNSIRLRNILYHEHGHGMGQLHVCPLGSILMNPFINTAFDGPQYDDVLNAQRHYGDPLEPNDSIPTASNLGSISSGNSINVGGTGPNGPARVDFVSVDDNSDLDYYRIELTSNGSIAATATPLGFTYTQGPQTQACNTGTTYTPISFGNLRVRIYNSAGLELVVANDTPAGSPETAVVNANAGTYYIRVDNTGQDNIQAYRLDIDASGPIQIPLSISLDGPAPAVLEPGLTTDFGVTVQLNDDSIIAGPFLNVRASGAPGFTAIPLVDNGGGQYTATLPAYLCDEDPEYFVSVGGSLAGVQTLPQTGFFDARVGDGFIFTDSGEGSIAFTIGGNITTQEAGRWTNGTPQNNGRDDPPSDFDGNNLAWLTGQSASTDNSDVDGGSTILISPVYDFSQGGTVSFAYWMQDSINPIGAGDGFTFEISANGGTTWTVARSYSTAGFWRTDSFDIGALLNNPSQFRFRWVATDVDPGDVLECAVDAIVVSSFNCDNPVNPVCTGDIADDFGTLGADDQVSFGDFLALLGLIGPCPGGSPGCTGDIADDFGTLGGDGQVSFGDFLALLGLIGPCPE